MKQKHFIDSHKGATAFATLETHRSLRPVGQPDRVDIPCAARHLRDPLGAQVQHLRRQELGEADTLWYGLLIWFALTLYWTAPYIICSQGLQMPLWWLALCTSVYTSASSSTSYRTCRSTPRSRSSQG